MSDTTSITGIVHKLYPTRNITNEFSKRELVIKTEGEYPQYVLIQFTQKNIDKLDNITIGSRVCVNYNLRGKMWKNNEGEEKCLTNLEGWRIVLENETFYRTPDTKIPTDIPKAENKNNFNDSDSLPF